MPEGNPIVGEVWSMIDQTGRTVRGIVADVTPNVITLVSFTGNRFRVAPARMLAGWVFSQLAPATALRCSRGRCTQAGTLRFQRGTTPEWVCPRHLPVGVQASLTTESIGLPQTVTPTLTEQCPVCENEDVEPTEDARVSTRFVTFWQCGGCATRWGALEIPASLPRLEIPDYVRMAIQNFVAVARELQVTITEIHASPNLYLHLHLQAGAVPSAAGHPEYLGYPLVSDASLGNDPRVVLRTRGAPVVRPAPRAGDVLAMTPQGPQWTAPVGPEVTESVAQALRQDRAERRVPNPLASLMGAVGAIFEGLDMPAEVMSDLAAMHGIHVSESEYVGAFPIRQEIPIPPLPGTPTTPFVAVGQKWVQRKTGDILEVTRVQPTDDRTTTAVHFRRVSDGVESSSAMVLEDFLAECRPFTQKNSAPAPVPSVFVLQDEEWEHIESGEVVKIDSVDSKRDLVIVAQKDSKRRSVALFEFVNAKWRKIVRRTAYARLLDDGDD